MKKCIKVSFLFASVICFSIHVSAQQNYWAQQSPANVLTTYKAVNRQSFPTSYKLFQLTDASLKEKLFSVVDKVNHPSVIISLPNADGDMEQFEVFEASNFEPALQARYPGIRAFSGKGVTDKYASLKLSYSPKGIHTMVFRTEKQAEFIEPYSQDHTIYAVFKSQRRKGELPWACSTPDKQLAEGLNKQVNNTNAPLSSTGELKTMRLAQSVTAEYSNYFGATSATQSGLVLAAVNVTLTRSNGCYEKDLGLHLNLIDSTTKVFYYNPASDPYSPAATGAGGAWNGELQNTLTSVIGEANYDIGHLFGASGGGGNAGCIGCVCQNGSKGSAYTSPADDIPEGDNFDIDYVVHEVGHQLGGNHTFSHSTEGSGVNKEVGSGITIMGYAGITNQDVAPHSIDIFHQASIAQIQANLATKTCPTNLVMTANTTPVVAALSNFTIPISTPFVLNGTATDAEEDPLTYCWEQNDNASGAAQTGANSVASPAKAGGPNWLSFSPTASGARTFPRLSTILAGLLVTPPLPGGDAGANIEALSSVSRTLNFRLTVRDNHPYVPGSTIGQTQFRDMVVTVSNTSGPFQVTSPNTNVVWQGASSQTITWNVANTTTAPVSCANVKISLSTDGGLSFPNVLAASTANDGTEIITLPSVAATSSTCRIKVEAVGNIFFDISNTNFTITGPDVQFEIASNSQIESTVSTSGCRKYKDYTVNMKVNQPLTGTGAAIVTINSAASATATNISDFEFTTNGSFTSPSNTLAFTVGGATVLPVTLRIYDDASVEGPENIILNYSLAAGATNAISGVENQTYTFTIIDNDLPPQAAASPQSTIGNGTARFMHPFRGEFNDARTQILLTAAELNSAGFFDSSLTKITELAFNVTSKNSTIPYTGFTIRMKNTATAVIEGGAFETGTTTVFGPVNYSTTAGTNNFVLTTPFGWDKTQNLLIEICYDNANGVGGRSAADSVMCTIAPNSYMHYDRSTTNGTAGCALTTANFIPSPMARPNITLKQQSIPQTPVETVLSSTQSVYLGPYADIYVYSSSDNELIARVQNLSAVDYGCTAVTIDRAGSSSSQFWNSNTSNYLMNKSIKIIPTNTSTTGNYKVTLYYTAAEVSGWQTATARTFASNQVVKVSNGFFIPDVTPAIPHIADVVITGGTIRSVGTHSAITGEFYASGFSGFGVGYPCGPSADADLMIWTGAINTDWFNTGNWSCGTLPGPTSAVQINGSLLNYPLVNSNVTVKSLKLQPGASCNVSPGVSITLAGQ